MAVYKILLPAEWAAFEADGRFGGSPFDERSGFIHLSGRAQVGTTATRFFADEPRLVVAAVDDRRLGPGLRWEAASDGGIFPHLYGVLPLDAVVAVYEVPGAALVDATLSAAPGDPAHG